ncbi:MAG: DNA mismatch repair endonuclease MutL [Huintestinicola sp.]
MPKVHVLDKELAELIAAGEVIERPSSVIKELVENSIDSGASAITVEIKNGGISYIRITDNGCGISYEDVPTAFLRHATSKLSVKDDLSRILTLGFRGEALASICAVSKTEVFTKTPDSELGTHYVIEGTEEKIYEKSGCPDGTTIVIRDIFYNVPARLKFLKKDVSEGNAVAALVNKISVSHPEISFRFIRNNRQELFTPGDNQLFSAVYSVFGKEFAASMIPVNYKISGISAHGYTVKPLWGRKNRTMQTFYINGRYVKSVTCMCALEEAYRNTIMEGKFPACVLFLDIPPGIVDVNVHPAKTEVRFADEKLIYDTIYFAVKNALLADVRPAEMKLPEAAQQPRQKTAADYAKPMFSDPVPAEQTVIADTSRSERTVNIPSEPKKTKENGMEKYRSGSGELPAEVTRKTQPAEFGAEFGREKCGGAEAVYSHKTEIVGEEKAEPSVKNAPAAPVAKSHSDLSEHLQSSYKEEDKNGESLSRFTASEEPKSFKYISEKSFAKQEEKIQTEEIPEEKPKDIYFRIIGEAFKNYAIAETEDGILIVDKHAAHERILFERLRTGRENLSCQTLLDPVELRLDYGEYDALGKNLKTCADAGFMVEMLEAPKVLVKGIPSVLESLDAGDIVTELAENFAAHKHDPLPEILDDIYHTIACRSAIKANDITGIDELKSLVKQILTDDRIRYCPHGRPVMFKLTKKELEKQFRRIV